jgi:hypothetical protein
MQKDNFFTINVRLSVWSLFVFFSIYFGLLLSEIIFITILVLDFSIEYFGMIIVIVSLLVNTEEGEQKRGND